MFDTTETGNTDGIFLSNLKKNAQRLNKVPKTLAPNWVLIEVDIPHERKTESGIHMLPNPDYTSSDSTGQEIRQADHAPRWGKIIAMCDELYFNPSLYGTENTKNTLEWNTEIEIQVGDTVWFSYLKGATGIHYMIGDKLHYLLRYDSIYAIKKAEYPLPINGWIVFETVENDEIKSDIIIKPESIEKVKDRLGIARYISKRNKEYIYKDSRGNDTFIDDIEVKEGDICMFSDEALGKQKLYLEGNSSPLRVYDKRYFMFQRRDIGMIY